MMSVNTGFDRTDGDCMYIRRVLVQTLGGTSQPRDSVANAISIWHRYCSQSSIIQVMALDRDTPDNAPVYVAGQRNMNRKIMIGLVLGQSKQGTSSISLLKHLIATI